MLPSEPKLTALLEAMYRATLRARDLGYGGKTLPEDQHPDALLEVSDLMDAIHNIPLHFNCYETWNETEFVDSFLRPYDEKWSARSGISLVSIYQKALAGNGAVKATRDFYRGESADDSK